ncbi:MAG TPA: hypothetical protein VH374_25735 [Polyangia bacterium]|jgi:hypothetical protein|nr:hypothetical protein [Polyangia bacterium]
MPAFDWMEPKRNPEHARTLKAKREAMYLSELEDRAGLLHRLGHGRDAVRARLNAQLGWDFEDGGNPIAARQLDAILDRVYGGGAARTMTRTSGKGAIR